MKFKIDENLPIEVAELLQQTGHDALTVHDQNLVGSSDPKLAAICQSENRVVVTLDTDFADIRAYPPVQFAGLVVLRLKQQDKFYVLPVISRFIRALSTEELDGRLWIVEENKIRIRS
jgi:predicted nuclease of predicted toxin-antitoxin system